MSGPADSDWRDDVLDFWFRLPKERWWKADPELDAEIRRRFSELWSDKRRLLPDNFLDEPRTALAAVILFDQFPRNMLRGHADQYSTDHLAIAVAQRAADRGFDDALSKAERGFLYMPLQHSEEMDDQRRSLALFTALGDDELLWYAKKHHEVIERFGRFPHRNAIIGRKPRPDELAAGEVFPW